MISRQLKGRVVDQFHALYYEAEQHGGTWGDTRWLGVRTRKCPMDLWVYQEILTEQRPDVIVETGTAKGGSSLFLASLCTLLDGGRVITVDIEDQVGDARDPRVSYLVGSSTADEIVEQVEKQIRPGERVMVILDSDHRYDHVLRELELYAPMVTPGSYLIVEDTNVNGHPVKPGFGPGPMEALDTFLASHPEFEVDPSREKFLLTFNPRGYLRRLPG